MEKKKILVVEDEEITAMDIKSRLQKLGYSVPETTGLGEEAITLAEKLRPDLILMDVVLKGKMDGTTAAQHIARQFQIPIVFLTAYSDDDTIERVKLSAPYGYINKPFETKDLQIAIAIALSKRNLEIESAAETNRLKSEFLANMTHEIRTPLNSMIGFTELLYNDQIGPVTSEQKDILQNVLSHTRFLLRLLSDILDYTHAQSNKIVFFPQSINITKVINELIEINQETITNKKININIEIQENLPDIVLDPERLKQVLSHYLSNAIKFSREGGDINICVSPENSSQFRLEVKDGGIGIDPDKIEKLFAPFLQLDGGMSKKYQGAGIGLALVRQIVQGQHGQVGVQSSLGKGSVFYLILPFIGLPS